MGPHDCPRIRPHTYLRLEDCDEVALVSCGSDCCFADADRREDEDAEEPSARRCEADCALAAALELRMAEVDDSEAFGAERSEPAAVRRVCGARGEDAGMQNRMMREKK